LAKHSDFSARLPRNLKVFYHMTGVIRTLQLQKIGLENAAVRLRQGAPASCLALLDDRITTAKRMIGEYLASRHPLGKPHPRWHSHIPPRMIGAAAEVFIIDKMKAMAAPDPSAMPGDEELHTIRKAKKDLLYAYSCLPDASLEEARSVGLPSRKDIQAQAQLLGDLHDIVIQLSLLKDKYFLLNTCPQSSRFLEAAQQLWLRDKQELLDKIKIQVLPADPPGNAPAARGENPLGPLNLEQQSYELHVE
jgi:CHAD domain-containing protein